MMIRNLGRKRHCLRRKLAVIFVIIVLGLVVPSIFAFLGFKGALKHGKASAAAYKSQQFDSLKKEVSSTKNSLKQADISLTFFFWLKIIPVLGGYFSDIKGLTFAAVEDLAAIETILSNISSSNQDIGFDGNSKSGPERFTQAINVLNKSLPYLSKVEGNMAKAADAVRNIDTGKYPDQAIGIPLKKNLGMVKNFILGAGVAITHGREALEVAPQLLGVDTPKTYLLLFQNDKEIRATGGFITAYATLSIKNGQVSATTSDDIYRLDEKLLEICKNKICPLTPPPPIVKYLPEVSGKPRSAWSMRDSNMSPDVPTSAKEFERMYTLLGEGLPFDGIIFIDSQVVEELIDVTGPIDIFGTEYSANIDKRCNCPNVIYELESYAEIAAKGEKDRKAILGVLMQQILARSVGADIERLPQLVETIARLASHKHIMFFMHDDKTQRAISALDWTGEIKNYEGDYIHINDSNFAGGKSNLYVEQTVIQDITINGGSVKKKITIEYKNPQAFGIWLNGINRDYVRLYVPQGSKLISAKGSEVAVTTIDEELGKTVFEAFIQVRPQNTRKLEIEYTVPYQPKGDYKMLIQKQPGAKDFKHIIKINGSTKADFKLEQDQELKLNI